MQESYTRQQLSTRNGVDRDEMWIAYQGVIYEVGFSRHWRNGIHYGHWAGQDLSEELTDAPHAEEVFRRCKVVGKLVEN